ncbi:glucosyltransferase domain-containing protein [Komagataeibacter melomenusus]
MAFSLPLINANIYYQDDLGHSLGNPKSWLHDGRPLAYGLMCLLGPLWPVDSGPWPQVLGLFMVALTIGKLGQNLNMRTVPFVLSFAFLICQPFYLENLSYRYDSFFMSLSICFALMPFITPNTQGLMSRKTLRDAACLFLLMNAYQAAINIFFCFSFIEAGLMIGKRRNSAIVYTILCRLMTFVLAYGVYKVEELLFVNVNEYAQLHAAIISSPAQFHDSLLVLLGKLKECFWGGVYESLLVAFIAVALVIGMRRSMAGAGSRRAALGNAAMAGLCALCILSCFFGLQILLRYPVLAPRTFIGFGGILTAASLVVLAGRDFRTFTDKACFVLVGFLLCQGIFQAASYANAIRAQTELREHLAEQVIEDISDLTRHAARPEPNIAHKYWLWGTIGHEPLAPLAKRAYTYYPSLDDTIMSEAFIDRYTVSPIFMYDIMRRDNLPDSVDFLPWRLWEYKTRYRSSPAWQKIEQAIHQCSFDGMKEHADFNTYKIGRYIITDYTRSCSRGAVITTEM